MRLYFIRHGETEVAGNGVYGPTAPLTALGLTQALQTANVLCDAGVTSIVSSPAVRALQTAEPLRKALGLESFVVPELIEIEIGRLAEGEEPYEPVWVDGLMLADFSLFDGESFDAFSRRALSGVRTVEERHTERDVVAVFTHGGVKNIAVDHYSGRSPSPGMRILFDNCSISMVDIGPAGYRIGRINDTSHLI